MLPPSLSPGIDSTQKPWICFWFLFFCCCTLLLYTVQFLFNIFNVRKNIIRWIYAYEVCKVYMRLTIMYIKLRMHAFLNHKTEHKLIGPVSAWNKSKKKDYSLFDVTECFSWRLRAAHRTFCLLEHCSTCWGKVEAVVNPQPSLATNTNSTICGDSTISKLPELPSEEQNEHYKRERVRLFILDKSSLQ
jgi:hypothetical protein